MGQNIRPAVKITGIGLFSCLLSLVVVVSLFNLFYGISTKVDYYEIIDKEGTVLGTSEKNNEKLDEGQAYRPVRTEVPTSVNVVMTICQLFCSLGIYFCTTGSVLAALAAKDRNNADFNGIPHNKNRGALIGLLSVIPQTVLFAIAFVAKFMKPGSFTHIYYWVYSWIIMAPVKPIVDLFTGGSMKLESIPVWAVAIQGLVLILFVGYCYLLYRVCYNADSFLAKLLYKSTKKDNNVRRLGGR